MDNGRSIKIWKDKWLSFRTSFLSPTPWGVWEEDGLICDLIDNETKQWKGHILQEMFASNEATKISELYVSKMDFPDELVWHFDRKGHYTVKSGYRHLWESGNAIVPQDNRVDRAVWEKYGQYQHLRKFRSLCGMWPKEFYLCELILLQLIFQ